MKKLLVLTFLGCLVMCAFRRAGKYHFTVPDGWPKPAHNFKKYPLSQEKLLLGRALFYDPLLSADSTISCSSCHSQYAAFTHIDHALSHGISGRIGRRNSLSLMNLAWQKEFMWDGRAPKLEGQAILPITHPDEMAENLGHVVQKLQRSSVYPSLFSQAFGDTSITSTKMLEAISQFMLSLVSCQSRYDSVIRGDAAFTLQESSGYALFKKNCSSCHTEPLFTNLQYENNGLPTDPELNDLGRLNVTHNPADSYRFKVPTLRNIELSTPYMHDGRFKRLYEVLNHYTTGIKPSGSLAAQLRTPILLTSNEKVDLVAFLMTLTDRHYILNPDHSYPKNIFPAKRMNN